MSKKPLGDILIFLSVLSVAAAGYVFATQKDLAQLAGTQWILIGIVLGIYGLYAKARVAE